MENKREWGWLIELLPHGRENGISMHDLSNLINTDDRTTRKIIWQAKADGEVIASGDTGYFVPVSLDELREFVRRVAKRQKSTAIALAAARRKVKELEAIEDNEKPAWSLAATVTRAEVNRDQSIIPCCDYNPKCSEKQAAAIMQRKG